MIAQADVWWADLGEPIGSQPGYRRPVIILQSNDFNRSRISTVVCVPLTSNVQRANSPGNVLIPAREAGLAYDSVANVSQITTIDRSQCLEKIDRVTQSRLDSIFGGLDMVLGR